MIDYLLDTNALLRFVLRDNEPHAQLVRVLFHKAQDSLVHVTIPMVVFVEVVHVLLRLYKFPKGDVIAVVQKFLDVSYLEIEKREILVRALALYTEKNISFVDCLLVVEAQYARKTLFSFDVKLQKLSQ